MIPLLFAAALSLQATPPAAQDQVDAVTIEADRAHKPPTVLDDKAIEDQFNDLLKKEPGRMICLKKAPTGTRIARPLCGTLREWYDFEAARNTDAMRGGAGNMQGPPYELVDLVKSRMANSKTRAMAEARAGARLEAEAQARADQP